MQLRSALQRVNKYVEASQSITELEGEQLRLNKQPKVNWLFIELSKRLEDGEQSNFGREVYQGIIDSIMQENTKETGLVKEYYYHNLLLEGHEICAMTFSPIF
ncbi:hypothetical protein H5410_047500 [Solanum commersonii]|uniref:Uncharacterized protein n=1 Tax=Solanum commersonii TaxID=4109 RepID=A0A9J5XHA3_SOLCO|nr:hypothetical protein H5410_047500 [Solanum commersonii]